MSHAEAMQEVKPASLVPSLWQDNIRQVDAEERSHVGRALSLSFATDPLSVYLLAGEDTACLPEDRVWKLHVRLMTAVFDVYHLRGIITTVGSDYESVAMWTPPGRSIDGWWASLCSGLWRMMYHLPAEARRRYFDELAPAMHNTRVKTMGRRDKDTWYLGYIGTKPSARGKGYATKLIRAMSEKADAANQPIYLEASSFPNTGYYARLGFVTKTEIVLTRGPAPIRLYCMVREPQPSRLGVSATESSCETAK